MKPGRWFGVSLNSDLGVSRERGLLLVLFLPVHLLCPLSPKTPISFPLISSSKAAVFRDIFSCLVVSDWLWCSCCLPAALYTNSEQCQKSKITGMPSPWVRGNVATWSPLCVYVVLLESILKPFQATPWGEHSREPSGQAWSELPVPPPPHLSL